MNSNNVSEVSICRYCIKTKMLPRRMSTELDSSLGNMPNVSNDDDLRKVVSELSRHNLELDAKDQFTLKCGM